MISKGTPLSAARRRGPAGQNGRTAAAVHARPGFIVGLGLAGVIGLAGAGCANSSAAYPVKLNEERAVSPAVIECRGDWDDIETAIDAALTRCWLAIERRTLYGPGDGDQITTDRADLEPLDPMWYSPDGLPAILVARRIEADLVAISGVTGELVIERLGAADDLDRAPVRVICKVGLAGDPEMEACLVESICERLRQLEGVETAPLRW